MSEEVKTEKKNKTYYSIVMNDDDFTICFGVYTDYLKAYGFLLLQAQYYIDDLLCESDSKEHAYTLSPIKELNGETGFFISVLKDGEIIRNYLMLTCEMEEE